MGLLDENAQYQAGEICYQGKNLARIRNKRQWQEIRRENLGMIMQNPQASLNPLRTIGSQIVESFLLHGGMSRNEAEKRTLSMLADAGFANPELTFKLYPHALSGGQLQRVGIARATIMQPALIVADEPVSALDVSLRSQILQLMMKLQEKHGLTYLLIAHDLSVMRLICNRIGVIKSGRLVELGTTEQTYHHPTHPYTRSLLSAMPLPNPIMERTRTYCFYEEDVTQSQWTEIEPGHYVLEQEKHREVTDHGAI